MENSTGEQRIVEQPAVTDILNGRYRIHYTGIEILPKALNRGLYSGKFAARIGDSEYGRGMAVTGKPLSNEKYVWLNSEIGKNYSYSRDKDVIGILIEGTESHLPGVETALLRIAPRKFVGVVILDDYNNPQTRVDFPNPEELRRSVDSRIEEVKTILAETNMSLPIYGSTGNLYWPQRINHDQIVSGSLKETTQPPNRSPLRNLVEGASRMLRRRP